MKGFSFYKKINNITGWLMFAIALVVYTLTMEKSGSFWDCGEFVAGAYKLQVVHPPGAPFFNIIGRIFTLFAEPGTGQVAIMINFLSAMSTAFVSLFCFWITTALGKKVLIKEESDYDLPNILALMGAGLVAGLASTFADSIWFSAVEGEVYALSIFFMTFVVWAALKWEADESEKADRWLVLIALMIGLSTGVHLLSLLALPFVGIIVFYKKFKFSWGGLVAAFLISFVAVYFVMLGVIQGVPKLFSVFELIFVNSFGLGFNTGIYVAILFIVATLVGLIYYSQAKNKYYLNLSIVSLTVLLIGYSSYALVPIRSAANTPINMNRPTDAFTLLSYLNREQYGERPLISGPDYTAEMRFASEGGAIAGTKEGRTLYVKDEKTGKYEDLGKKTEYEFTNESKMFFPRLGVLGDNGKIDAYRAWINPSYSIFDRETGTTIGTYNPNKLDAAEKDVNDMNSKNESRFGASRYRVKDIITWGDNIKFFFEYQLGYMYMRYFMWNFSGRQNDIQGTYANSDGGWIVGIDAIDDALTIWGNPEYQQAGLSPVKASNYARNKFYAIPFLLGLIGLFFIFKYDWKFGIATVVLFLTTGVFFIVYGNQPPIEPRERDYVIAGSIFTYSIYIGFALLAIFKFLRKNLNGNIAFVVAFGITIVGPALMGMNGWDDHNRSGRTTAVDFASNYLNSCEPNAIIFTQGDNDTYPLWYAQEVEGIRTDVRVVNLSLLGVDWYVNQLRYKMNDADPLQLTFTPDMLRAGNRDQVRYVPNPNIDNLKYYEAKEIMNFIATDNDKLTKQIGAPYYLPTRKIKFTIDRAAAEKINLINKNDSTSLNEITLDIDRGSLMKNDLITLDIIANNLNTRPIYFAVSVSPSAFMGFQKYFVQEGLTYRIVPRINKSGQPTNSPVNTEKMYVALMDSFKFGQIDTNPNVYVDENISRMTLNLVSNYVKLAKQLIQEGQKDKALKVLEKLEVSLPLSKVPYNFFHAEIPGLYAAAGNNAKAEEVAQSILKSTKDELNYYVLVYQDKIAKVKKHNPALLPQYQQGAFIQNRDIQEQMYLLQQGVGGLKQNGINNETTKEMDALLIEYRDKLTSIQ